MDNPFAPLPVSSGTPSGAVWREGDVLRSSNGAVWPCRCVVCGRECSSNNELKLQLQWHPSWVYVFIVISLWIYLIAAAFTRRRAAITVFLCDVHLIRRQNGTRILIGFLVGGLAIMFGAFSMDYVGVGVIGVLLLLGGVIMGSLMMRTVRVIRIENDELWLKPPAVFMEKVA